MISRGTESLWIRTSSKLVLETFEGDFEVTTVKIGAVAPNAPRRTIWGLVLTPREVSVDADLLERRTKRRMYAHL